MRRLLARRFDGTLHTRAGEFAYRINCRTLFAIRLWAFRIRCIKKSSALWNLFWNLFHNLDVFVSFFFFFSYHEKGVNLFREILKSQLEVTRISVLVPSLGNITRMLHLVRRAVMLLCFEIVICFPFNWSIDSRSKFSSPNSVNGNVVEEGRESVLKRTSSRRNMKKMQYWHQLRGTVGGSVSGKDLSMPTMGNGI